MSLDLDRMRQEIEACAPEFEGRERPWNQAGLTLVQVGRSLLDQLAKTRAELEQTKAQRNLAIDWLETSAELSADFVQREIEKSREEFAATRCKVKYTHRLPLSGRERVADCWLDEGHVGEHWEQPTDVKWPQAATSGCVEGGNKTTPEATPRPASAERPQRDYRHHCGYEYIRPGGRQRGDRIVKCGLWASHDGPHEEDGTGNTWPRDPSTETCGAPGPNRETCAAPAQHAMSHWAGGTRITTWTNREVPGASSDGERTA